MGPWGVQDSLSVGSPVASGGHRTRCSMGRDWKLTEGCDERNTFCTLVWWVTEFRVTEAKGRTRSGGFCSCPIFPSMEPSLARLGLKESLNLPADERVVVENAFPIQRAQQAMRTFTSFKITLHPLEEWWNARTSKADDD